MNLETVAAALLGAAIPTIYLLSRLRATTATLAATDTARREAEAKVVDLRREMGALTTTVNALRSANSRKDAQIEQAARNKGWRGIYTKPDGSRIHVEGHGTRNGTDRPIVENLDRPGSTLFDVARERVSWEG